VKGTDRVIVLSLALIGLLAAFYFMVLAPKRDKASALGDEITQLQDSLSEQEQVAAFGEQARQEFPRYYGRLVVLGKAVPEQADSASMLVQLGQVANQAGVEFRQIALGQSAAAAAAPAPAPAGTGAAPADGGTSTTPSSTATPTAGSEAAAAPSAGSTAQTAATNTAAAPAASAGGSTSTTTPTQTAATNTAAAPAPATEATAASLPIGATVGPGGLPVLPYDLAFKGTFFDVADFMSGLDSLVHLRKGSSQVAADGRLITVDGFSLTPLPTLSGVPELQAEFAVTTYVVPPDQGLTAGASPSGPATSPAQPPITTTSSPVAP
jgi:Tfp pilus assembly protein PilO